MNIKRILVVSLTIVLLSGCVAQWQKVNSKNAKVTQQGMTITLPDGWVTIAVNKNLTIASKDGPSLNSMLIETIPFSTLEKVLETKIKSDMDVLEASKTYISYWSKMNNVTDFDIVSEDYREMDSVGHYFVEWTHRDSNGTTMRHVTQGTIKGKNLVKVSFSAPNIHYFNENLPAFNQVVEQIEHAG
ncbi:hypothetical protein [Glaciecola sp. 1036]|uniref:hypothetical protein n=1 Tax=Alteromonadaceae TaxID=72275 RepID=UPI003D00172E